MKGMKFRGSNIIFKSTSNNKTQYSRTGVHTWWQIHQSRFLIAWLASWLQNRKLTSRFMRTFLPYRPKSSTATSSWSIHVQTALILAKLLIFPCNRKLCQFETATRRLNSAPHHTTLDFYPRVNYSSDSQEITHNTRKNILRITLYNVNNPCCLEFLAQY